MRHVFQRYLAEENVGLGHRLRDQVSNRSFSRSRRERVLKLYQAKYGDFGPRLASEYLAKDDGESLSEERFRLWLIEAGLGRRDDTARSSGPRPSRTCAQREITRCVSRTAFNRNPSSRDGLDRTCSAGRQRTVSALPAGESSSRIRALSCRCAGSTTALWGPRPESRSCATPPPRESDG